LTEKYPQVYLSDVIRTLENLRKLYIALKKPEEAEKVYKEIMELKNKDV